MPKRIQRKRAKGWRMPPNAVYVGRPTKWGNAYAIGKPSPGGYIAPDAATAVRWFRADLMKPAAAPIRESIRNALRGKDLACWCAPGSPCHADVLLEIANNQEHQSHV